MPVLRVLCLFALMTIGSLAGDAAPQRQVVEQKMLHLCSGMEREWSEFSETSAGQRLDAKFSSRKNSAEQTLLVRQQDVKQVWNVLLNGTRLGELVRNENDMIVTFAIPASTLIDGENSLRTESPSSSKAASDDIRVGQISIRERPLSETLREATLEVEVVDEDTKKPLPSRITVLDANGAMQTLGAVSNDHLAVWPGMAFTSTGRAIFGVPAGRYTIFAGRGVRMRLPESLREGIFASVC